MGKLALQKVSVGNEVFDLTKLNVHDEAEIAKSFIKFIETANTVTDRATHHETKEEVVESAKNVHRNLFSKNRGLYAAALVLPGSTDFSKEIGVEALLSIKNGREDSIMDINVETMLVVHLLTQLKAHKLINLFLKIRSDKVNNARTRRIVLSVLLNHPNLEYWSVKYRKKLAEVFEHVWGKKNTGIIKRILDKDASVLTEVEGVILTKNISKFIFEFDKREFVFHCLSFILGNGKHYDIPVLKSFVEAKDDLNKGNKLPKEVLEGLRSTYHKSVDSARILDITKANLTEREKMKVQKNAASKGVEVKFDANKQDIVDLFVHAFAQEVMTDDVKKAIAKKGKQSAKSLNFNYGKVGIVFDASKSAFGDVKQKMRPMAIQSAMAEMLKNSGDSYILEYCGGVEKDGLVYPMGETNIAKAFVKVLKQEPDAIFVLSDGYENAPAGRFDEVLRAVHKIGMKVPVFQISPVTSAVTEGVKKLSEAVSTIPANNPKAIGSGILKALIEQDLQKGLVRLVENTSLLLK